MSEYSQIEKEELAERLRVRLSKRLSKGYELGMVLFTLAERGEIQQEDIRWMLKKIYGGNETNASRAYVMARELMDLEPATETE